MNNERMDTEPFRGDSCLPGRRQTGVCPTLCKYLVHDSPRHIGQPEIAAAGMEGEPGVIDAELVQDGGMQVVHADRIFGGLHAEFVGGAVDGASADAATGHPDREAIAMV